MSTVNESCENILGCALYDVLIAILMEIQVFWGCELFLDRHNQMLVAAHSEMSVTIYHSTCCNVSGLECVSSNYFPTAVMQK